MATAVDEVEDLTVGATDPRWAEAGVTYRRLDFWTTHGFLRVAEESATNPGSGRVRRWPVEEIAVAERMVRLADAGLPLAVAADIARQGPGAYQIGPGVELVVTT